MSTRAEQPRSLCCGTVCGGGVQEGTMLLARLSLAFSHFLCYPQANWALLILIHRWVGLCTFWDPGGLSNKLSCEAGNFSRCCNLHSLLPPEVLRLYFPMLEPWVVQSVLLPVVPPCLSACKCGIACCTSHCLASSLHSGCPSLPL